MPGMGRFFLGILMGIGVIIAGDIMTYGFSQDYLPGTTTFWLEDLNDAENRLFAFKTIAYAIIGALIARLVGGRRAPPLIVFVILFIWTLVYGLVLAPENFGSMEDFLKAIGPGAALFGGSALLCSFIPRKQT